VLLLEKKIEIDEGGEYLRLIWIEKSGFTKKGFLDFSVEFAMNEFVKFENALHNIYIYIYTLGFFFIVSLFWIGFPTMLFLFFFNKILYYFCHKDNQSKKR
jgi:hypothetical protein